ncbi:MULTISPECIES: esterase-like activity of phytase family protein [unclassified Synechocystis]|uniref:esterase-like activity of phytase family protein n=1 Tax=unclassified Synechocystis TaxID=2640012 RepID=UPI001CB78042|nr:MULTISPECIES: esterase-like activity of phytase family protein [unclassified Synechocystis]UOO12045.1 esterase-like activity of phytase family protein [Synechocystis sp. PCC 6803]
MTKIALRLILPIVCFTLVACGVSPDAVQAESRLFLPLSLEFLDSYTLPKQAIEDLPVGGISDLTYDRQQDLFYAVTDDRRSPRFYTMHLTIVPGQEGIGIAKAEIVGMTKLRTSGGEAYGRQLLDPEGIALSPRQTLFISSEGVLSSQSPPLIAEFDPQTGQELERLPLPSRFLPQADRPQGIRDNFGFEALTIAATSTLADDPFRLFTATESVLAQDFDPENPPQEIPLRWLHYVINSVGAPVLVSENLYPLDPAPAGTLLHGLSAMVALPREGYFLTLERTFGLTGFQGKIFQTVNANATDTSRIASFQPGTNTINPMRKELLLDLEDLGIELDNLEGITLGPRLPDGSTSLIAISDDNFSGDQSTQILLFRLQGV